MIQACSRKKRRCSQPLQSSPRNPVLLYRQFVSQLYSIRDLNSDVKLNKVTGSMKYRSKWPTSDWILTYSLMHICMQDWTSLHPPDWDTNFDLNLDVLKSLKHEM